MFLLTLLGILLLLGSVTMFFVRKAQSSTTTEDAMGRTVTNEPNGAIMWFNPVRVTVMFLIGVALILSNGSFFYANPGVNYMVQYPWGGQKAVTTPGLKTKWFGEIIPISNEIVFKYVLPDSEGNLPKNSDFAILERAQQWEFNDAIKGDIATSVIIGVNVVDDATFIDMVEKNKSEKNLVFSRIIPTVNAALKNSAKLMSAQEYLVGRSSDFDYFFRDQLENGVYRLEERYVDEEPSIIGDTTAVRTVGIEGTAKGQPNKKVYVIMEDRNGDPVRQLGKDGMTVFSQYNLNIVDAITEKIDWEQVFDTRLETQKKLVADLQEQKQEAEKEFYRAQKEEQAGEANKIKRQKELELKQIEETVAAETRMKSAKYKAEEEQNLFTAAKIEAQRIKTLADAEAYKNRKLVTAGLTPQEQAYWDYRSDSVNAAYISKMATPQIMSDGANGGLGSVDNLLQLQVLDKLNKANK